MSDYPSPAVFCVGFKAPNSFLAMGPVANSRRCRRLPGRLPIIINPLSLYLVIGAFRASTLTRCRTDLARGGFFKATLSGRRLKSLCTTGVNRYFAVYLSKLRTLSVKLFWSRGSLPELFYCPAWLLSVSVENFSS